MRKGVGVSGVHTFGMHGLALVFTVTIYFCTFYFVLCFYPMFVITIKSAADRERSNPLTHVQGSLRYTFFFTVDDFQPFL